MQFELDCNGQAPALSKETWFAEGILSPAAGEPRGL